MMRFTMFIMLSIFCVTRAEDYVLDDFNSSTELNAVNLYWYYFSDINDDGNSVIHNTTTSSNGSFSEIVRNEHDNPADLCAVLEFTLGDVLLDYVPFNAFVGIGTDIATPGNPVDLSTADSISFMAMGTVNMTVFIELASPEVEDTDHPYLFYMQSVEIGTEWSRYAMSIDEFHLPQWWLDNNHECPITLGEYLKKIIKINWQVVANDDEDCNTINTNNMNGALFLDNVTIHGTDSIAAFKTVRIRRDSQRSPGFTAKQGIASRHDLLGRSVNSSRHAVGCTVGGNKTRWPLRINVR